MDLLILFMTYTCTVPPPGGQRGLPARASNSRIAAASRADSSVLSITDALDFTTVPRESSITKELFFDAKEIKGLGAFNGEYFVSAIYSSSFDGSGLDIGTPVWTGTLVSEEVPITFEGNSNK